MPSFQPQPISGTRRRVLRFIGVVEDSQSNADDLRMGVPAVGQGCGRPRIQILRAWKSQEVWNTVAARSRGRIGARLGKPPIRSLAQSPVPPGTLLAITSEKQDPQ